MKNADDCRLRAGLDTSLVKDFDYDLLGGESRRELAERCVACIHDLTAWYPGERVLVVAHGGVLNCLFHFALGLDWHASRRFSLLNIGK